MLNLLNHKSIPDIVDGVMEVMVVMEMDITGTMVVTMTTETGGLVLSKIMAKKA